MSIAFILAPIFLFVAVCAFLLPILVRLFLQGHAGELSREWFDEFTPVTYQPMDILLAEQDFEFLTSQPGFEPALGRKLRRDRIAIFRQYLYRLIADFNRLHRFARHFIADPSAANTDLSGLMVRLLWLRVRFSYTVIRVEASLLLSSFGCRPRVVKEVIAQLDEMNCLLRNLVTA